MFAIFAILLALFWLTIGVMLAKWLKQAGHTKPFSGRERDIYGGAGGVGRSVELGGGSGRENLNLGGGGRYVGIGEYGEGRVKGL
jgi:hypothetical protein